MVCLSLCGPAMSWQLATGVSLPSPYDSWARLQQATVTTSSGTSGYRKWMDNKLLPMLQQDTTHKLLTGCFFIYWVELPKTCSHTEHPPKKVHY